MWFKFVRYDDDDELQEFFVFFEFSELENETKEKRQKLLKQFPGLKVKLDNANRERIQKFKLIFPTAKLNPEKKRLEIDKKQNPGYKSKIIDFINKDNEYTKNKEKEIAEEIKLLQSKELKQTFPAVDEFSKDLQNRLNKSKSNKFKR